MEPEEPTRLRPWFCDECGELNNSVICQRCGIDAPSTAYFQEETNRPTHFGPHSGGILSGGNFNSSCLLLGILSPLLLGVIWAFYWIGTDIWNWIQGLFR